MRFHTLISCAALAANIDDPNYVVVDCRFSLDDSLRGRRAYLEGHIPGAVYAHMDDDLSGPVIRGKTGRHPLPTVERFSQTLSRLGIDRRVQVVVYDDKAGATAARLWWMLRWVGHDDVAVLDGGILRWRHEGRQIRVGPEERRSRVFQPVPRPELAIDVSEVLVQAKNPAWRIFDSRIVERYRGEKETIYPVAGHIAGALNAPHPENLKSDGGFKSAELLRARFQALVGPVPAEQTVFYCGAGVTAAHNVLAFAHAGLGEARLYVGSWSEWITDPNRPIERA